MINLHDFSILAPLEALPVQAIISYSSGYGG